MNGHQNHYSGRIRDNRCLLACYSLTLRTRASLFLRLRMNTMKDRYRLIHRNLRGGMFYPMRS